MIGSKRDIKKSYFGLSRGGMIDQIERLKADKRILEKRIREMRRGYRRVVKAIHDAIRCHRTARTTGRAGTPSPDGSSDRAIGD